MIKVLLVDDEGPARSRLGRLLKTGFEVIGEASSLAEAEEALEESVPDVLFVDIRLPEGRLGGPRASRKRSTRLPVGARLAQELSVQPNAPLVVLLVDTEEERDLAFEVGATDWLARPVRVAQLQATLKRLERRHESRQEMLEEVDRLKAQTQRDALTGAYNRRFFEERLQEEIARAQRHRLQFALLMLDVDHFKKINDNYGHQIGDDALRHLVKVVITGKRQADVLARYGGEEFALLLVHTDDDPPREAAERIRVLVETTPVPLQSGQLPITVSIGGATLGPDEQMAELIGRADEALYQAKRSGRNRVAWSGLI